MLAVSHAGWVDVYTQGVVGEGSWILVLVAASGGIKHLIWLKIAQMQTYG